MAKKYYITADYTNMPKDGLRTTEQKIAFEEWRDTHPSKPQGRRIVGKMTEHAKAHAAKYKK